ncbi:hypothetical protein BJ912DRAFT_1075363, partial [Pholiota molesta]
VTPSANRVYVLRVNQVSTLDPTTIVLTRPFSSSKVQKSSTMYDDALSLRNFAQELRQHDFERPPQRDIQRYPLKHDRSVAPMPYLLFLANGRASVDRSMVSFILGFHIYTLRRSPSGTRMSLSVPIKSIPRPHTDLHRACAATFIHQIDRQIDRLGDYTASIEPFSLRRLSTVCVAFRDADEEAPQFVFM